MTAARPLPAHLPPHVRAALAEARARLAEIYGPRLARVVLYGSHARGDARPDSDVDVLVVLDGEVEAYAEIKRTGGLALDLLVQYDADISMQPFSRRDADDLQRPLMRAVLAEGVEL